MKVQIRRSVFETNSSSVHSISIIKDDYKGDIPNKFEIDTEGEFGWEAATYEDSYNKGAYLFQAIVHYPAYRMPIEDELKQKKELLDKYIKNLEHFGIEVICKHNVLKTEHKSYKWNNEVHEYDSVVYTDADGNKLKDGYLDHGGEAKEFVDFVLSTPENTLKFIFDDRCYIDTGNDNSEECGDGVERNYGDSIIIEKGN